MKRWHHITWKSALGVIAVAVLLLATAAALFRTVAPLVPGYREQVQAWASRVLNRPVEIASIGAGLGLTGPELTLGRVAILSHDRRYVVIEAREVRLGFTLGAVLHGQFSRPSRVILLQPKLVLERETDGRYEVRGLEGSPNLGAQKTDWRAMAAEAFAQNAAVRVREGQVTLIDMRTPNAPLVFRNLSLNLDNSRDDHRLSGRLQLPAALGRSLAFSAQVRGAGLTPEAWHWHVEFQGDSLELPRWLEYWPDAGGRFRSGQVDLRAAVSGVGARLDQAKANVTARQIAAVQATSGFDLLSGSLHWARTPSGWTLGGSQWQLRRGRDIWPVSRFHLRYAQGAAGPAWSGDASFLRLQDVALLSTWLPSDFGTAAGLHKLSPSGDLNDLQFSAQRSGKKFATWALSSRFDNLGMRADGEIPGFSGLSGTLNVNQGGGTLALSGANAAVTFPHLFRGPLTAATLRANLEFQHQAQGWLFTLKDLSASNQDVQRAVAHGTLLLPAGGGSPQINLQASVQNADARNKSVYFPVGIMPKPVVAWLDSSIIGGEVPEGSLVLRGRLEDFPYANGQGLFDIRFHLLHGQLDYARGWPPVKDLEADVEFKNQGMYVNVRQGMLLGDQIGGTTAEFADLRNGLLHIQGTARGSAAAALEFLRRGPLRERFGHVLDGLSTTGAVDVGLNLHLPVEHVKRYTLDGGLQLRNVSLAYRGLPQWPVTELRGRLNITQNGVRTDRLQAAFLGKPLQIKLSPNPQQDTTRILLSGGVQAAQLAAVLPAAFKPVFIGAATWRLTGTLPNKPAESTSGLSLVLQSDLQGLGLNLPPPFAKATGETVPLRAALDLAGDNLDLRLDYGRAMRGIYRLRGNGGVWRFDRGALVFDGGRLVLPSAPGLMLGGRLPEFSLDAWKPYLPAAAPGAPSAARLPAWLQSADLSVGQFAGLGQHIENLQLRLTRAADHWSLALASQPLAGSILWPFTPDAAHPIVADFERVTLTRPAPTGKTARPSPKLNPRDVPPLRLHIKQLRYNDIAVDNLDAELEPQADGLNLKSLSVASPSFDIHADGRWLQPPGGGQQTTLNVQLQSRDVQQTLQSFGYAPGISGDSGELRADLHWAGGPLAEILPMLNGKLYVKLQHGSLLEIRPGAGRIFGLLSINALPRHLLLNFSDVLGKGFAYDSIEGHFVLQNGDAYTSDLTVSGPAAKIHMVGRTGLVKHDFDEAVVVLPSVGSSLPVLGALAGGVGVGAVVFLLTEIFRKPLSAVGESRYRLTGTWDNPKLTAVVPPKPAAAHP